MGDILLAEFHTHPHFPEFGIGVFFGGRTKKFLSAENQFASPSAPDLYQLALAAAKGQHNHSFIIASEGAYVCRIQPTIQRDFFHSYSIRISLSTMAKTILEACLSMFFASCLFQGKTRPQELGKFLNLQKFKSSDIQHCINECEQPIPKIAHKHASTIPNLCKLLDFPTNLYLDLIESKKSKMERIDIFCSRIAQELNIELVFLPANPYYVLFQSAKQSKNVFNR